MKTMTCNDLGGVCDEKFHAGTFDEMVEKSMNHGMDMAKKGDVEHIKVMEKMGKSMENPEEMQKWVGKVQEKFDSLPEDN